MVAKIREGSQAPELSLPAHTGGEVSLQEYRGKWVVLFFYPADDTPVCTKEACFFRDAYQDFVDAGAVVLGISNDSLESHESFAKKHRLPYPLLTDKGGKARKLFQVPKTLGLMAGRVTYVIDPEGVIRRIFSSQLFAKKHVQEALQAIQG